MRTAIGQQRISIQLWFGSGMLLLFLGAAFFLRSGLQTIVKPDARVFEPPYVLCSSATVAGGEPLRAVGAPPRPVPRVVSSEPLAHVPGKRITVVLVDFPPGSASPPHRHGGSVSVYVLSGKILSQLGDGPRELFAPGGTFFEPLGIIHTYSGNPSATEPAQVMAIFVHDEGATLTTYLE